jgi:hypothetical protein
MEESRSTSRDSVKESSHLSRSGGRRDTLLDLVWVARGLRRQIVPGADQFSTWFPALLGELGHSVY